MNHWHGILLQAQGLCECIKINCAIIQEGKTIIMIEHRLKELFRIADRIVVLNYGEKIADGKSADVMESDAVKNAYLGTEA